MSSVKVLILSLTTNAWHYISHNSKKLAIPTKKLSCDTILDKSIKLLGLLHVISFIFLASIVGLISVLLCRVVS